MVVAIVVPWLAFRYALRLDQRRWIRDQRSQAYIDLIMEVTAERDWFRHKEMTRTTGKSMPFDDHRMKPFDRQMLGVRVYAYGSDEVYESHNSLSQAYFLADTRAIEDAASDLLRQIRAELRSEQDSRKRLRFTFRRDDLPR